MNIDHFAAYTGLRPGLVVTIPLPFEPQDDDELARAVSDHGVKYGATLTPLATFKPHPDHPWLASARVEVVHGTVILDCAAHCGRFTFVRSHPSDGDRRMSFADHSNTSVPLWARNLAGRSRLLEATTGKLVERNTPAPPFTWSATPAGFVCGDPECLSIAEKLPARERFTRTVHEALVSVRDQLETIGREATSSPDNVATFGS